MKYQKYLLVSLLMLTWTAGVVSVYAEKPSPVSREPLATPTTQPEKGVYGAADRKPLPPGGWFTPSQELTEDAPITEACFKISEDVELFCIPDSTVQWGAESLSVIGNCENKDWDTNKESPTGDWSLWQTNRYWHEARLNSLGYGWEQVTDPTVNGILALSIWSDGQHWGPWSCRKWAEGVVVAESGGW